MKLLSVLLLLLASLTFADDVTRRTVITLGEPLVVAGVPQVTLPPGKYVIKVVRHDHTRNIVQIFNERENKLFTTILAINNYRLTPTDKTVLKFWETPRGNPPALRAWFAPGDQWGQEFVYPKNLATALARDTGGPVLTARATTEAELLTAPVTEVMKSGEEKPLEEVYAEPPAPARPQAPPARPQAPVVAPQTGAAAAPAAPTQIAQATPPPARPEVTTAPAEKQPSLPATGSPVYAVGLAGLLIAGVGFVLRRATQRL